MHTLSIPPKTNFQISAIVSQEVDYLPFNSMVITKANASAKQTEFGKNV